MRLQVSIPPSPHKIAPLSQSSLKAACCSRFGQSRRFPFPYVRLRARPSVKFRLKRQGTGLIVSRVIPPTRMPYFAQVKQNTRMNQQAIHRRPTAASAALCSGRCLFAEPDFWLRTAAVIPSDEKSSSSPRHCSVNSSKSISRPE